MAAGVRHDSGSASKVGHGPDTWTGAGSESESGRWSGIGAARGEARSGSEVRARTESGPGTGARTDFGPGSGAAAECGSCTGMKSWVRTAAEPGRGPESLGKEQEEELQLGGEQQQRPQNRTLLCVKLLKYQ